MSCGYSESDAEELDFVDDPNEVIDSGYEAEDYSNNDDIDGEETWIAAEMLEQGNTPIATHSNQLPSFEMVSDSHTSTLVPEAADTSANLTISGSTENTQATLPTAPPTAGISAFHYNLLSVLFCSLYTKSCLFNSKIIGTYRAEMPD